MKLFGTILPFIGWRHVTAAELSRRGMQHIVNAYPDASGFEVFDIEWLTHGVTLTGRAYYEAG